MNRKFAKLNSDGSLSYAPDAVTTHDGAYWPSPLAPQYADATDGPWMPVVNSPQSAPPDGTHYEPTDRYEEHDGRLVRVYEAVTNHPAVIRYSGWGIYKAIKRRGYADALNAYLATDADAFMAFVRPQYFLSDDEDFQRMLATLCAAFNIGDAERATILEEAIDA